MVFIKSSHPFVREYAEHDTAPLFRRAFTLPRFKKAEVLVAAPGIGVFYINGQRMTRDLHITPTSNYEKTVWFNRYDVTELLCEGDNLIACVIGNGWYNESLSSPWDYDQAPWRDQPKFALSLLIDGKEALNTDETWLCKPESWITFNQLRSGEHVDMRLFDPSWKTNAFDDSDWENASADDTPPRGILRECPCPPVRECAVYPTKNIRKTGEKRYLFDIGQNISGYVHLRVKQKAGDKLTIRYFEQCMPDGTRKDNGMPAFYPGSPFQTDELILSDAPLDWSPSFTYHGFRYIEVDGLDAAVPEMVEGIFIHLDVEKLGDFACSNEKLNALYRIAIMACYSNMHYLLTDCPTREKLGWLNDARASTEHLMINFDLKHFYEKWIRDIMDSVLDDGALSGIAPTSGCMYDRLTGPICTSCLHEIAYRYYLMHGDDSLLKLSLPYMLRHLDYLKAHEDENGIVSYGLGDWAGPFPDVFPHSPTPSGLTDTALYTEYLERARFAAERMGDGTLVERLAGEYRRVRENFMRAYIAADGRCTVNEETAVSTIIVLNLYDDFAPLAEQLKALVEAHDYHIHVGMLGVQFLYKALTACDLTEYAYRILTAEGFPSYMDMLTDGATSLYENFMGGDSKNHHMYSSFIQFLMDTLAGIQFDSKHPGGTWVNIAPKFIEDLDWCRASRKMVYGTLSVSWKRKDGSICLNIAVPEGMTCCYKGEVLSVGEHTFTI